MHLADRLYLGSATGSLHIYGLGSDSLELVEIKKSIVRRAIEQLGFLKDVNSLVVLSGTLQNSRVIIPLNVNVSPQR